MIVLLRSTGGNPDSRYQKYIWFLEQNNIPFFSICWDRDDKFFDSENYCYFHKKASYGDGIKNAVGLITFNLFLFIKLFKIRKKIDVIHAADFDTVLPAVIIHKLYRKKIIYDIYDWFVDSRCIKNKFFKKIIYILEGVCIRNSERVILCEPEREKQILYKPKNLWIFPNIPNFDSESKKYPNNNKLTISYVGILGKERGLENLVSFAKSNPNIIIHVAGFGCLEYLFKDVKEYPNINYIGSVPYKKALEIMASSDIIYACYETSNPNHILAAPNKYYEGLYLGKPIITTKGTIVGEKTKKFNTGYVIDESFESLNILMNSITKDDLKKKEENSRILWEKKYKNYVNDFFFNTYLPFITSSTSK